MTEIDYRMESMKTYPELEDSEKIGREAIYRSGTYQDYYSPSSVDVHVKGITNQKIGIPAMIMSYFIYQG